MTRNPARILVACLLGALLAGCVTPQEATILSTKGAVELRAMQTRAFETGDRSLVFRTVIATLQDLGYSIAKLEPAAGTVTADKLSVLTMTATVYGRSESRTTVRANAVVKLGPATQQGHQVDAPEFYQQRFFEPLSKALFLTALQVEEQDEAQPGAPDGSGARSDAAGGAGAKQQLN